MALLPGVYTAKKKDGSLYYRASITYRNKHISLGSFPTEELAHAAYLEADRILKNPDIFLDEDMCSDAARLGGNAAGFYEETSPLSFEKWVVLTNFRDNRMYIKTPIYMKNRYFLYYLDRHTILKFAVDDLFFYATHKIMRRGGHLFVADFGMQVNILSRYGIKSFGVPGRDYIFVNGDCYDFRYENIQIINYYNGVLKEMKKGFPIYTAKIHINGDFIIGRYSSETEAAIAYNKAVKILHEKGVTIAYTTNYVAELSREEYAKIYEEVKISKKILNYTLPLS